jgi:hypothetical protein
VVEDQTLHDTPNTPTLPQGKYVSGRQGNYVSVSRPTRGIT